MVVSKWYMNYRNKIRKAGKSEKELDKVIDEIFEEGVEVGKEEACECEREPVYNEGYD